jgi:hypothetical protein
MLAIDMRGRSAEVTRGRPAKTVKQWCDFCVGSGRTKVKKTLRGS